MESLEKVTTKMQEEVEKGRATDLRFEKMVLNENSYKSICSEEKLRQVFNYMLRLSEYRTGAATVINNVYMDLRKPARPPQFTRTHSAMDRMLIDMGAIKLAKKIAPFYDGDCQLEEAKCYFHIDADELEKHAMEYKGGKGFGLLLSNTYIMGIHCICNAERAKIAMDMEVNDSVSPQMKLMALTNIREVLFQSLLLDDVWLEDGFICCRFITIYVIE